MPVSRVTDLRNWSTLRLRLPELLPIVPANKTSFASTSVKRPYTDARTWLNFAMKACFIQSTTISDARTKRTGCTLVGILVWVYPQ